MFDVALFVQDDVLAQRLRFTLEGMGAKVARYGALSNDSTLWRSYNFDLMVAHPTSTVMDLANTFMPKPCGALRAATLAVVPDLHMAFAPDLLDAGFDRCLPLSLDGAIFCAEVRALTRRSQGMAVSISHYGALSFNHATQCAYVSGVAVDLTAREAQVLDILLKRVGQIVSKDFFIQEIGPDNMALNSSAAEVYIHRLRKKINHDLLPVRNIKRCGYFLPRYMDPSDSNLYKSTLSEPAVDLARSGYELVRSHFAV